METSGWQNEEIAAFQRNEGSGSQSMLERFMGDKLIMEAPTAENIKNGSYPIVTPIYAVTYEENANENVDKLLDWILSEEGQYIIEETGYVGIGTESLGINEEGFR